jgi:hypothetical protein
MTYCQQNGAAVRREATGGLLGISLKIKLQEVQGEAFERFYPD